MHNKVPKNEYLKGKPGKKQNAFKKDKVVYDQKSMMGYRDDSPYRQLPFIDINTPNGYIDMSYTGMPLFANGQYLPPYSGQHFMGTNIVREVPIQDEGFDLVSLPGHVDFIDKGFIPSKTTARYYPKNPEYFQYGGDPSIPELTQAKKGGWLNKYSKMPKKTSSKNIKTSINKLMVKNPLFERNYMLYGAKGPRLYDPSSKYKMGGWLDSYQGGGENKPSASQEWIANNPGYLPSSMVTIIGEDNKPKQVRLDSQEYSDYWNKYSGKILQPYTTTPTEDNPEGIMYQAPTMQTQTVTDKATGSGKHVLDFEKKEGTLEEWKAKQKETAWDRMMKNMKNVSYEDYLNQRDARLTSMYEDKKNNYVAGKILKDKPKGDKSRADWNQSFTPAERYFIDNSNKANKIKPNIFQTTAAGISRLNMPQIPGLNPFDKAIGLTPEESKNISGANALDILSYPTNVAWGALYDPEMSFGDALSGQQTDKIPLGMQIAGDPLNLLGIGLVDEGADVLKGVSRVGDYLTTQTPLKNTYKINPWAEKLANPNRSYRVAGMDAARDFEATGVLRSNPTIVPANLSEGILGTRTTPFPSFQKGYADLRYLPEEGGVIFETDLPTFKRGEINPVTGNKIRGSHYAHRAIDPTTGKVLTEIPSENVRMFGSKPNWLRGYKPVEVPAQLPGSPNAGYKFPKYPLQSSKTQVGIDPVHYRAVDAVKNNSDSYYNFVTETFQPGIKESSLVNPQFGHDYVLPEGMGIDELNEFARRSQAGLIEPYQVNDVYESIVKLNPELKKVNINKKDLIHGVASHVAPQDLVNLGDKITPSKGFFGNLKAGYQEAKWKQFTDENEGFDFRFSPERQKEIMRTYKPTNTPAQLPGSPNNVVPKTPPNPALGNPMGTTDDIRRSLIPESEYLFPSEYSKRGVPFSSFRPEAGGYTDIPQFNQQVQNFNTQMQFGKRPLETQINVRPETQKLLGEMAFLESQGDLSQYYYNTPVYPGFSTLERRPLTGYQMFQQIQPNKYGGTPRKSDKKLVNYSQNPNFVKTQSTSWLDKYQ